MRFNKEMLFSKGKKKINGVLFRVDIVRTYDEGNYWMAETRNHSGGYLDIVGGAVYRIECSGGSWSSSTSAAYTASKPYVGSLYLTAVSGDASGTLVDHHNGAIGYGYMNGDYTMFRGDNHSTEHATFYWGTVPYNEAVLE